VVFRKLFLMDDHVCPWWLAPTFDNPLRRLVHKPETILGDLIQEDQVVMDIGCGMGYFSVPMAQFVGPQGKVIAVDLQKKMLERTQQRAVRAKVESRLQLQQATPKEIGVSEPVDFALAFWMVHEVPDQLSFLRQIRELLKPNGRLLIVEPIGHVSQTAFQKTVATARSVGLEPVQERKIRFSRAVLFRKTS
jgi:ubiquinone/menaquinone biosynthesis C-methylase UbiE